MQPPDRFHCQAGQRRTAGIKACVLAVAACLFAHCDLSFVASAPMVQRVGLRTQQPSLVRRAAPDDKELDDDDEGFWSDDEGHEEASPEFSTEAEGGRLMPSQTKADVARQRLWNMPKEVQPFMNVGTVTFKNKENRDRTRDLVVLKAKNSKAMIERSQKIIKSATLSKIRMKRMMRFGREDFGRDSPWQWNRPGRRAFRMRSGMRDLRYVDEKERYQRKKRELRWPDQTRKRKRERPKKELRWIGSSHRYGRGTQTAGKR
ncbi:unnamed protein product [Cladocopium goreaui]|uniref:Uncharacterized protein n=1 Tax=Cladocopium goreaui TaxID=2562237 RepID=A0A9P1BTZ2_9DINO|nr:unnamed protein product [Cladocopium goreaui]